MTCFGFESMMCASPNLNLYFVKENLKRFTNLSIDIILKLCFKYNFKPTTYMTCLKKKTTTFMIN